MKDLIDLVKVPGNGDDGSDEIFEPEKKRKPKNEEAASRENIVQHSWFEYYVQLYKAHPEMSRQQFIVGVADKFNKGPQEIEKCYKEFRWYGRGKQVSLKDSGTMPKEATEAITDMLSDAYMISKLGSRLITDYIVGANPEIMSARDIFKLGMLVVECIRVTNEVGMGNGKGGQAQGQVINLVINE